MIKTKAEEIAEAAIERLLQIIRAGNNEDALIAIAQYTALLEVTRMDANG